MQIFFWELVEISFSLKKTNAVLPRNVYEYEKHLKQNVIIKIKYLVQEKFPQ